MLESHPFLLNVHLLQPSSRRPQESLAPIDHAALSSALHERLAGIPSRRQRYLELATRACDRSADYTAPKMAGCFRPLMYSLWGSFDLLALYFSFSHVLYTPSRDLIGLGESIQTCFLPKPFSGDTDINGDFFEFVGDHLDGDGGHHLDPEHRFVLVLKVKLAPLASWPARREAGPSSVAALADLWDAVVSWRKGRRAGRRTSSGQQVQAAFGLSLGWNEVTITALAPDPSWLIELCVDVRGLLRPVGSGQRRAHVCLTTISVLGWDQRLHSQLCQEMSEIDGAGASGDEHADRALCERMLGIARRFTESPDTPTESAFPVTLSPTFTVNPGHERTIATFCSAAQAVLGRASKPHLDRVGSFEFGKVDVTGPAIRLGAPATETTVEPHVGAAFAAFVQLAVARSLHPECPNYFDSITRASADVDWSRVASLPDDHFVGDPRHVLFENGRQLAAAFSTLDLRDQFRWLQVSYAQTEQWINLVSTVRWLWNSFLLWEEAIEMVTPLLALQDYTKKLQECLSRGDEVAQTRLVELPGELEVLFDAYKSAVHNRRWTGYHQLEHVDQNPRHRGALQQLLTVATMLVSTLSAEVIGPRACIASVGDVISPESRDAFGVTVLRMPSSLVDAPILLDSVGLEVGRRLMGELVWHNGQDPQHAHDWRRLANPASFENMRAALVKLDEVAFNYGAWPDAFVDAPAAFMEMRLLGCDWDEWMRSLFLRFSLSARAQRVNKSGRPEADLDNLTTLIGYVIEVCAAATLLGVGWPQVTDIDDASESLKKKLFSAYVEFRSRLERELEGVRDTLRKQCVLPQRNVGILDPDPWSEFAARKVGSTPWLRSPRVAFLAYRFFDSVDEHLRVSRGHASEPSWRFMAEHIRRMRREVLQVTDTVVYHRTDMTEGDRMREGRAKKRPGTTLASFVTPAERTSKDHSRAPTLISPRGRIVPRTEEGQRRLATATSTLYAGLLPMIPCWRRWLGRVTVEAAKPGVGRPARTRKGSRRGDSEMSLGQGGT